MRELSEVLTAYQTARTGGEPLLLATLVRVEGSTYRRPGARMLMTGERQLAGGISGGCLESDVLQGCCWRGPIYSTAAGSDVRGQREEEAG